MITVDEMVESGNCPCEICSSQDDHPFLTTTKEELDQLPPIPQELENELRIIARKLRQRVEEEWDKELLQKPLKNTTVKTEEVKNGEEH